MTGESSAKAKSMVWSYSRAKAFEDCPYRWYLKYIQGEPEEPMFFSSYGTFMHRLIESYLNKEKTRQQLVVEYLVNFRTEVKGLCPSQKIFDNYFTSGLRYLEQLQPPPYNVLETEKNVRGTIAGKPFRGFIDVLGEDITTNKLIIIDHKSRLLKPRSTRKTPTKTDNELDSYLTQLYLYAEIVKQLTGEYPSTLCFNCFRSNTFIAEPFREERKDEAIEWLAFTVDRIERTTDFYPSIDWFYCSKLCGYNKTCDYYALSQNHKGR